MKKLFILLIFALAALMTATIVLVRAGVPAGFSTGEEGEQVPVPAWILDPDSVEIPAAAAPPQVPAVEVPVIEVPAAEAAPQSPPRVQAAASPQARPGPPAKTWAGYYGVWDCGPYPIILTITGNTLEYQRTDNGGYFKADNLQWREIPNESPNPEIAANYPSGCAITGRVAVNENYYSDAGSPGETYRIFLYLHTDGRHILDHRISSWVPYTRSP
jgi:hypothetical protein